MGYNDKLAFCLPGKTEPEEDVRVVVHHILSKLRDQHYTGEPPRRVSPVNMSDFFKELGYPISQYINLMGFLQKSGLLVKLSVKQGNLFLWYCTTEDILSLPLEFFEAAWREVKEKERLKEQLTQLNKQFEKFQALPDSTSAEFLGKIDAITAEVAAERDAVIVERDALRERIVQLENDLAARPNTKAEVIEARFLKELEKYRSDHTPPTRRRGKPR